jgi:threonine dehydratase
LAVTLADIVAARPLLAGVAEVTPVFNSRFLSEQARRRVVVKAENLQRTGSFKIRGATCKLANLSDAARAGVVVASAGNHAQAVAFAARARGVPCEVFMPRDASIAKAEATRGYGATVHLAGDSLDEAMAPATARAAATGMMLVHPFDDPDIVAGQGTLGLELIEQVPDLSTIVIPLGGGGLAGGVAMAVKSLRPNVRVVAVQSAVCAPFPESIAAGVPVVHEGPVATLADGIAVRRPGDITLPLVERYVDEVVTVDENEIADAMVLLLERAKLVVEGAGAVGVAALLWHLDAVGAAPASATTAEGSTVVVLSGGNVDLGQLTPVIRRHETNAGRRIVLFSRFPDRPGQLAKLLLLLGEAGANLIAVEHLRDGYDLQFRETGVNIVVETRDLAHADRVITRCREAGYVVERAGV